MLNPEFTDVSGRKWTLRITLAHMKPLKEAGFDVNALRKDAAGFDALADPETFGRVMYLLCEAQADKANVSPEEFAAGFDGPTIHAAGSALLAAIVDLSNTPTVAKAVREKLPAMLADVDAKSIELLNTTPAA